MKAVAVNGSPRKGKGTTGMILNAFTKGMEDASADVEVYYTKNLKLKFCTGEFQCWGETPGECYIRDGMQQVYPALRDADTLILATPVYVPLPGEMQIFINRLVPLILPRLETRKGRTRARLRDDVRLRKVVLVSTGAWWERENLETVVRIAKEIADTMTVEFVGAVLRPHAYLMKKKGELTEDGAAILDVVKRTGYDFAESGKLSEPLLDSIRRPLISQEDLLGRFNKALESS